MNKLQHTTAIIPNGTSHSILADCYWERVDEKNLWLYFAMDIRDLKIGVLGTWRCKRLLLRVMLL